MHRLRIAVALTASALAVATTAVATPALASTPRTTSSTDYYLSLGDSLSQGVQPLGTNGASIPTNAGFSDQLHSALAKVDPSLGLVKLGCPGETTTTMLKGGICGYKGDSLYSWTADAGSQVAAAVAFLKAHPGQVPLVTIVIGANDVLPCAAAGTLPKILACLEKVLPVVQKNLAAILTPLRAADPTGQFIGMAYYDPLLQSWFKGSAGQTFAKESIEFAAAFRSELIGVYSAFHVRIADVYTAFKTTDMTDKFKLSKSVTVPEDVGLICERTWMCAKAPQGPNIHANALGYKYIAATFLSALVLGKLRL